MTKKRFTISSESNQNIWDNEEKCYYSSIDAIRLCDLLNELNQEAKDNEHYHTVILKLYKAISKENEQLKQQLREEQLKAPPITLTSHLSAEECEEIANLIRSALSNNQTSD